MLCGLWEYNMLSYEFMHKSTVKIILCIVWYSIKWITKQTKPLQLKGR